MSGCCDEFSLEEYVDSFDMGINFLLGPPSPDEVIFIPSVDADGNLSWTNNGGLPNPPTVNIKGPPGSIEGIVPIDHGGTEATTAKDANANLGSFDLDNAVLIQKNESQHEDLNNYKTRGVYRCPNSDTASCVDNKPVSSAFKLVVMYTANADRILQRAFVSNTIYEYRRYWNGTTWSEWVRVLTENDFAQTTASVDTSYGGITSTNGCTVTKVGNVVQIEIVHGNGTNFSGLTGTDSICTIPSGYRPPHAIVATMLARDNGAWGAANYVPIAVRVAYDGSVAVRQNTTVMSGMKYITGSFTWITG